MHREACAIIMMFIFPVLNGIARNTSPFRIHTDFASLTNDGRLFQELYYSCDSSFKGSVHIYCYKFTKENDSVLVYAQRNKKLNYKKGVHTARVLYSQKDTGTYCLNSFYDVLNKTDHIPPGNYKTYITVEGSNSSYSRLILNNIDSDLTINSSIRKKINRTLWPQSRNIFGISFGTKTTRLPASKALDRSDRKMNKVLNAEGLTSVQNNVNGKSCIDLYYREWFVGRYEAASDLSVSEQSQKQHNILAYAPGSLANNDLSIRPTLFAQFRDLKKEKKKDDYTTGEISYQQNFSNGQEQYSDQEDNFYQVQGMVEVPVADMPVMFQGMYTSQDEHRQIKASYFRIHYDIEKAKDQLNELIGSYKSKYSETISKSKGFDQIYGSYLNKLEGQKEQLEQELKNVPGINTAQPDFGQLKQKAKEAALKRNNNNSNSTGSKKIADSIDRKYNKAEEKYDKLMAIVKQINKYKTLLEQTRNTNYFDSALVYEKIKDLQNNDQLSYKQLAKKADKLLPDGNAKKFATGITNLDAGIFPKNQSPFTMSGQTMRGLDLGYDFGFCQAGITIGNTEFIGRDGSVDKYFSYALNANCKPYEGQQIGLIYYTYLPSHKMLSDDFFKNADISASSFTSPVHIVSLTYTGKVSKYVAIQGELANSINQRDSAIENHLASGDKTAYNIDLSGNIPSTYITLDASYSKAGPGFQNNTLPITPAGTEQYRIAAKDEFFRSFLSVGIEYNYMLQSNFASSGGNKRWGFDIQTHTRRYPAIGLSYKPFSTFRSFSDTLNIPQRPIIGSAWTGKASYQLKRTGGRAYRFLLLYNKNTSIMDTINYASSLLQLTTIYTYKNLMLSGSLGQMQLSGTSASTVATLPNNTKMFNLTASYNFNKAISLSAGQDIGVADFGFCRYAINGSTSYRLKKFPLIVRIYLRYNTYQADQWQPWQKLYNGSIDLTWQFKTRMQTK